MLAYGNEESGDGLSFNDRAMSLDFFQKRFKDIFILIYFESLGPISLLGGSNKPLFD